MCVNNLTLDSAAAGIEPAISSCKYNALTSTPPSHTAANLMCIKTSVFERQTQRPFARDCSLRPRLRIGKISEADPRLINKIDIILNRRKTNYISV